MSKKEIKDKGEDYTDDNGTDPREVKDKIIFFNINVTR